MLTVESLTKQFDGKTAVGNVSFSVDKPTMIGIIGRSGAGKSTLLRMLNRLTDATDGSRSKGVAKSLCNDFSAV
jgi:phosphonate transport system ATP-binding protein